MGTLCLRLTEICRRPLQEGEELGSETPAIYLVCMLTAVYCAEPRYAVCPDMQNCTCYAHGLRKICPFTSCNSRTVAENARLSVAILSACCKA